MRMMRLALLGTVVACHREPEEEEGPDLGQPMVLDEAIVRERFARLDAVLPSCELHDGSGRRQSVPIAGLGSAGSCGGTLGVSYEHGDGDTTYEVIFDDFCVGSGADEVVVSGSLTGFEDGTPSDAGPVVDTFSVDTEGPIGIDRDGELLEVAITGLEVRYGDPQPWAPGIPSADSPDVITVQELVAEAPGTGEPSLTVVDARLERVGVVPEVTVTDGHLVVEGEGHLRMSTPAGEPLTLDDLLLGGGTLLLEGADGVVLELVTGEPLVFDLRLDGQPLDLALDCSASAPLLLEFIPAILDALPVY